MEGANLFRKERNIDIVFCMDGTGSMAPCIENVKKNALRFYADFARAMTDMGGDIGMMRVRAIVFRDYKCDGEEAMQQSAFFELPEEAAAFEKFLSGVRAHGGCGEDANGLEALYYAMRSDFTTGANDRQIIVLFADTTALNLGRRRKFPGYPADMVDADGLLETWMCTQEHPSRLRERCKRLVMFAPAGTVYEKKICRGFNRSVFVPVQMSRGLGEIDFKDVVRILAASASAAS